jgi:uncharacterized C2H2 Zn-finger protein
MMPTHGTMKVLCPWCPEERIYKRVSDLKAHARQAHLHQVGKYPPEMISEPNSIWLSFDPEGYRKLVKGRSWGSTAATHARILVLDWLSRTIKTTRQKEEWQQGWERMKTREAIDISYPEQLIEPDYDEGDTVSTPRSEEYCPTDPHIDELEVEHVDLTRRKVAIRQGNQVFSVSQCDKILEDVKCLTSTTRKMSIHNRQEEPPFKRRKLVTSTTFRSRLTKFIGIEEHYVERVEENIRESVVHPPVKRKQRSPKPCTTDSPLIRRIERSSKPHTPEIPAACFPTEGAVIPEVSYHTSKASRCPNLSGRAKQLLMRGCLPLFQPARRDWDTKKVVFHTDNLNINWLPNRWKDFTPDRRLLSWEFTALTPSKPWTQTCLTLLSELACWTNSASWLSLVR